MNTLNGNFIEHTIPNLNNATLDLLIGDKPFTMNLVDFQTAMTPAPAYKVYTALLTQSGGEEPLGLFEGELTIGVTYFINESFSEMDFTNVGAPNNNAGTYFVATGTTPNSWGINPLENIALQYNTGAPVVTVLENTIGNVWFTYSNVGNYICYLPIGNISNTICFATNNDSAQNYSIGPLEIGSYVNGQVNIVNWDIIGNLFDGMYQAIEIRVYN